MFSQIYNIILIIIVKFSQNVSFYFENLWNVQIYSNKIVF